jgi:hypothetical protein
MFLIDFVPIVLEVFLSVLFADRDLCGHLLADEPLQSQLALPQITKISIIEAVGSQKHHEALVAKVITLFQ